MENAKKKESLAQIDYSTKIVLHLDITLQNDANYGLDFVLGEPLKTAHSERTWIGNEPGGQPVFRVTIKGLPDSDGGTSGERIGYVSSDPFSSDLLNVPPDYEIPRLTYTPAFLK